MATTASSEKQKQFLTVRLGDDDYGISLGAVREIVPVQTLTRVPGTPAWVRGVCNLRGTVLPIVDMGVRFAFGETKVTKRACIVVLELPVGTQVLCIGVMAEAVSHVIEVKTSEIEPPPEVGLPMQVEFVHGLHRANDRFVVLLDVARMFATEELVALEETGAELKPAASATGAGEPAAAPAPAAPPPLAPPVMDAALTMAAEEGSIGFFK